jgi:hypothetical protein
MSSQPPCHQLPHEHPTLWGTNRGSGWLGCERRFHHACSFRRPSPSHARPRDGSLSIPPRDVYRLEVTFRSRRSGHSMSIQWRSRTRRSISGSASPATSNPTRHPLRDTAEWFPDLLYDPAPPGMRPPWGPAKSTWEPTRTAELCQDLVNRSAGGGTRGRPAQRAPLPEQDRPAGEGVCWVTAPKPGAALENAVPLTAVWAAAPYL